MSDDMFNQDNWTELAEKKQGVKTLAKIPDTMVDVAIAYFKYPLNPNMGPIAANEYIAAKIGDRLGLPIPKVQLKEFGEKKGALVFKIDGEPNMWRLYPFKNDIPRTLNEYHLLSKAMVFDVLILNTDRNLDI